MMSLKLVTWEGDLTQFLVDAIDTTEAIQKAIKCHVKFDEYEFGERDTDDEEEKIFVRDMNDPCMYSVWDVEDMETIYQICRRTDISGFYENCVVLWNN